MERAGAADLLAVDDLCVRFRTPRGVVRAVDGVSLRLGRGRTLALVGESGSGKTVLTRSIMGLLSRRADVSGRVAYDGQDLCGAGPRALRAVWGAEMAVVFQDPMTSLNPVRRVGAQVTDTLRHHLGLSRGDAEARAIELLTSVRIPEPARRLAQYPHELSGGMRQRVTIAIALACDPRVLLADEPTTALDVTVQAEILDLLAEQQRLRHMALVLVTHDLGVVSGRADEVAVMYAGQIVEQAPAGVLFSSPMTPYTEALLRATPLVDGPRRARLASIPGAPPDLASVEPGCRFAPRCPHVRPRCRAEEPLLVEADAAGHRYRCWYPVGSADAARRPDAAPAEVS